MRALLVPQDVAQLDEDEGGANDCVGTLLPGALVIGETHGNLPGVKGGLKGGKFALISSETGKAACFGARPIQPLPVVPSPFGPIKQGISVVGTTNSGRDKVGLGYSAKMPTLAGDVLIFANARGGDGPTCGTR